MPNRLLEDRPFKIKLARTCKDYIIQQFHHSRAYNIIKGDNENNEDDRLDQEFNTEATRTINKIMTILENPILESQYRIFGRRNLNWLMTLYKNIKAMYWIDKLAKLYGPGGIKTSNNN